MNMSQRARYSAAQTARSNYCQQMAKHDDYMRIPGQVGPTLCAHCGDEVDPRPGAKKYACRCLAAEVIFGTLQRLVAVKEKVDGSTVNL